MTKKNELLEKIGAVIPEILLPNDSIDIKKWAVIACDQYTSEPEYWLDVENITKNSPSTFQMMLPEIYLENEGIEKKHFEINKTMNNYLKNGFFKNFKGFIYIERELNDKSIRNGLLISLDLEKYDYLKNSKTLIRATEGTVIDRLPPRVKIREKAPLELPHILAFIDDPEMNVIESLADKKDNSQKLYDFELMKGGNYIKGYGIDNKIIQDEIITSLISLIDDNYKDKYNLDNNENKMLFALGDGNHSFASAKVHWSNIKKKYNLSDNDYHPARYALVEIVNIHNKGIIFKSIDRVIFDVDSIEFLKNTENYFCETYKGSKRIDFDTLDNVMKFINASTGIVQHIGYVTKNGYGGFEIINPSSLLEHATITDLLDTFSKDRKLNIDYIHGENTVNKLGCKDNNVGFFLPAIAKNSFFESVIKEGSLPRKTFSIGDANEKRYYLESRKIIYKCTCKIIFRFYKYFIHWFR